MNRKVKNTPSKQDKVDWLLPISRKFWNEIEKQEFYELEWITRNDCKSQIMFSEAITEPVN